MQYLFKNSIDIDTNMWYNINVMRGMMLINEEEKKMKNFRIYLTDNGTYVVKADSKRFGKQSIVFESFSVKECVSWMYNNYRNADGKKITNSRWTNRLYARAMSTCKPTEEHPNPWYKTA